MHKVWSARAETLYLYAWKGKGAPCLWKVEGEPTKARALARLSDVKVAAQIAEKWAAYSGRRPDKAFISSLIVEYRGRHLPTMRESTQALYRHYLDEIDRVFGTTTIRAIQKEGARARIKKWHEGMSSTPNRADKALTALVGLFNFAIDHEIMHRNPAAKIPRLSEIGARAAIIWPDDLVAPSIAALNPERAFVLEFMYLTGMRPGDIVTLQWDEILLSKGYIRKCSSKSVRKAASGRKRRHLYYRIPLVGRLKVLLLEIKAFQAARAKSTKATYTHVFATLRSTKFASATSMGNSISVALREAKIIPNGLHFYDLRGTRATKYYLEGLTDIEVESRLAWAPGQGAKMRPIYVDADVLAEAEAKSLEKRFSETGT